jgi:ribosomal protein S18 acetylase RimI-like enzyme
LTPYKEEHIIYLSFLGVSESARGKGIGRKLLEVAIKTAKEKNYKAIR